MTLDINRIEGLCFDVDGTLSDTDDQFVNKLTRLLNPLQFMFPQSDPKPFARKFVMMTESPANILYGIPDKLGFDHHLARFGDFIYRKGLGKKDHPFLIIPGVEMLLEHLQEIYPMAIVSARGKRTTNIFLDQFGLRPFFKAIATAQTCQYTKPYPDPIIWAADQMGIHPGNCLMIGDTTVDILSAKAAGAQSVGVLCGFGQDGELRDAGADLIIGSTKDLLPILKKDHHSS